MKPVGDFLWQLFYGESTGIKVAMTQKGSGESIAQINTNRSLDSIPQPDWDLISLLKIPPLAVHIRSSRSLSKEAQK